MSRPVEDCLLTENQTLLDAMRTIEHGSVGIALLVDKDRHLLGTFTDGDIRRALLNGATLESKAAPFSRKNFTVVEEFSSRADVLDLMQSLLIHQIPILDKSQRVVGVHLLHEIIGVTTRPNWAVIMAGGRGTRLGELTNSTPKPMLRVAGRPILERLIWHLVSFGIRRIFISVNYLGNVIEEYFGDGSRHGCKIEYLREDEPLGTGGALSLLPEKPEHPLIVCNADIVTQADFGGLLHFHESGKYKATIGTRTHTYEVPFGCIQASDGTVTRIDEKPVMAHLISSGIYVIEPELLRDIPKKFYPITSLFEECLKNKAPIGAFEINEDWIDIGQKDQLRQARGE
ncbi:MAG: nucleotidyltransferase family protein [Chthoniobacterales bacterium]